MSSTYLIAPFRDKDQVKALGARWDPDRRQWYVPAGKDLAPFAPWLPAGLPVQAHEPPSTGWPVALGAEPGSDVAGHQLTGRGVSLSDLLQGVSQAVSAAFTEPVWVRVEVVDVRLKGHVYLELAERSPHGDLVAKCHAMIWSAVAQRILPAFQQATGGELAAGIKLLVRARPVFKAQYGFSLEVDDIDAQYTLGDLEARKREIRDRLMREGLFGRNRQLPAPWDYRHVLVVAPEGGAGLGDFDVEAGHLQRHGVCQFLTVHSRFQGEGAAGQIRHELVAAWENIAVNHMWQPDAVVIIRGGGAVNDLAWLNDYELARTICEWPVPVLTGIGHERDNTVLDEVAHTRFDTPSKVIAGIERTIAQRVREAKECFAEIAHEAKQRIQLARRAVEHGMSQVEIGVRSDIAQARQSTERLNGDIRHLARHQVALARRDVPARMQDIQALSIQHVHQARQGSESLMREIAGQGPRRTLERGFALVRHSQGQPVTRAAQLDAITQNGQGSGAVHLEVEFSDGRRTVAASTPLAGVTSASQTVVAPDPDTHAEHTRERR